MSETIWKNEKETKRRWIRVVMDDDHYTDFPINEVKRIDIMEY
jgi:hypothetical protein